MKENIIKNELRTIFDKAVEINTLGKRQAFVHLMPHTRIIQVNFYCPKFNNNFQDERIEYSYDRELVCENLDLYSYDTAIEKLDNIIKKDSEMSDGGDS